MIHNLTNENTSCDIDYIGNILKVYTKEKNTCIYIGRISMNQDKDNFLIEVATIRQLLTQQSPLSCIKMVYFDVGTSDIYNFNEKDIYYIQNLGIDVTILRIHPKLKLPYQRFSNWVPLEWDNNYIQGPSSYTDNTIPVLYQLNEDDHGKVIDRIIHCSNIDKNNMYLNAIVFTVADIELNEDIPDREEIPGGYRYTFYDNHLYLYEITNDFSLADELVVIKYDHNLESVIIIILHPGDVIDAMSFEVSEDAKTNILALQSMGGIIRMIPRYNNMKWRKYYKEVLCFNNIECIC